MSDTKDIQITEEMKLEKEIAEKQEKLHEIRYGEMETTYKAFELAREDALNKYQAWRKAAMKHGRVPNNILTYFNVNLH